MARAAALTIEELSRRTGMTVRNIRAHQSRGLVPAPEIRARTAYYAPAHVERLELIQALQGQGFNLEAIRRLLEEGTGAAARFTRAVREPFATEEPRVVSAAELAERWDALGRPEVLERAVGLGLIHRRGDGAFEERSPRLAAAGRALAELGIPPEVAIDVAAEARRHAEGVARAYVELFLREIWEPFERAGRPRERWPGVADALDRLRPLAADSLLAFFGLAMTEATDRALGAARGAPVRQDGAMPEPVTA